MPQESPAMGLFVLVCSSFLWERKEPKERGYGVNPLFYCLSFFAGTDIKSFAIVMDITLTEALELMEQTDRQGRPVPFSVEFDTYDQKTDSTSGRIKYDRAELVMPNKSFTRNFSSLSTEEYIRRSPNHFDNLTRNIRVDGEQIRKIHIHCILTINNRNVRWHIR